jgi:hypothetical protein
LSAVFREEGGLLVPTGHARGPWDPESLHGGAPSALLVRAVERLEAPGPMLLVRLTVEFLGPVPMTPLEVRAEVVRPGRRLQLAEASISAEGREVCRARAVRLRREDVAVPDHAVPRPRVAPPDELAIEPLVDFPHGEHEGFGRTAMELRFAHGHFAEPGRGTSWFRLLVPMVEGEEPSGAQRAVAAADFGNGISAELDFATHLFVNTDLTLHLSREPVGDWIAVEAVTEHGPEGTALASSVLHDERGPIGRAAQSLYVAGR